MEGDPSIHCADLALGSIEDARELLSPETWASEAPVSIQDGRTVWSAPRQLAHHGDNSSRGGQGNLVQTVRSVGRVRGASAGLLSSVLMDDDFRSWHSGNRSARALAGIIVPEQLWVVHEREMVAAVPSIQSRDCVYICTRAEQPDGAWLLIERSTDHDVWQKEPDAVRAWRFLAVSLHPLPRTSAAEPQDEPEVEVSMILQVDLGDLSEHFTSMYSLEQADLVPSIQSYIRRPQWAADSARLLADGPLLPEAPRVAGASRPTEHGEPLQSEPLEALQRAHIALHRAQVVALTDLRQPLQ